MNRKCEHLIENIKEVKKYYNQPDGYGGENEGIFNSYISAIAANSGCWEEYCEYHRLKREI